MTRFKAGAALAAAMMTGVFSAAEAQVLDAMKKSYQCAKQSAIATVELTGEVAKKAALATEVAANASACTAAQGGNPAYYVATTGAISAIKAVSPETIPTGQCHSAVKSTVSRPLLEGVSYLIPAGDIKNHIVSKLNSDLVKEQLWTAVDSIVVVKPFTMQVDCACTTIDNGLAMTDLKAVGESIGRVSSSCAAALDSLGLGFVNDLDNKVAEGFEKAYSGLSGGYDELVRGETDPRIRRSSTMIISASSTTVPCSMAPASRMANGSRMRTLCMRRTSPTHGSARSITTSTSTRWKTARKSAVRWSRAS